MSLSVVDLRNFGIQHAGRHALEWRERVRFVKLQATSSKERLWICGIMTKLLEKHHFLICSLQVKSKSWQGSRRWMCTLVFLGKVLGKTQLVFM